MKIIGTVSDKVSQKLNIEKGIDHTIVVSDNFKKHLEKRNHQNMYQYLPYLNDILNDPDYIGVNPREKDTSLEYIKVFSDNVLVGVKIDRKHNYFYVATMHEISNLKLEQRVRNGRLIKLTK